MKRGKMMSGGSGGTLGEDVILNHPPSSGQAPDIGHIRFIHPLAGLSCDIYCALCPMWFSKQNPFIL